MDLDHNDQTDDELREIEERRVMEASGELPQPPSPRPSTPVSRKALPWAPKVRQKDVDQFLDTTRVKFVGFPLHNDRISLAGLPQPIHEGVRVLKQVRLPHGSSSPRSMIMNVLTIQFNILDLFIMNLITVIDQVRNTAEFMLY